MDKAIASFPIRRLINNYPVSRTLPKSPLLLAPSTSPTNLLPGIDIKLEAKLESPLSKPRLVRQEANAEEMLKEGEKNVSVKKK